MAELLALTRLRATKSAPTITPGHLAPWQLRSVNEYLNAHLAENVELRALSDLVELSQSHLSV